MAPLYMWGLFAVKRLMQPKSPLKKPSDRGRAYPDLVEGMRSDLTGVASGTFAQTKRG